MSLVSGSVISTFVSMMLLHSSTAHAEVVLDGTLGSSAVLNGPDFQISADLGEQHGSNLFHSFQRFNLDTGQTAMFSGPTSVDNIIGRVTGGSASLIDGVIRSTIPGVNLYLINPSGVMLGPNASLNIEGSFYLGAADYVSLGSDGRFAARSQALSTLSSAPPSAFGFIGPDVAAIETNNTSLSLDEGERIVLAGGDITISDSVIQAADGAIDVAAVASSGEVVFGQNNVQIAGFDALATFNIIESSLFDLAIGNLDVSGAGGGRISIQADAFILDNGFVYADTLGANIGQGITVNVSQLMLTNGSRITTDNFASGRSGDIDVSATQSVLIAGQGGALASRALGQGDGGNITIQTSDLVLTDSARVELQTATSASPGELLINADTITLSQSGGISANTASSGNGSSIVVNATAYILVNTAGSFFTGTIGSGAGGDLTLNAPELIVRNGGLISSSGLSTGPAGNIIVNADVLTLEDGTISASGLRNGGNVTLNVIDAVVLRDGTISSTVNFGDANAANTTIASPILLLLAGDSRIEATADFGDGGNISITTQTLLQTINSTIDASSRKGIDGVVALNTPLDNTQTGLEALPRNYDNVRELLSQPCNKYRGFEKSHFVLKGTNGIDQMPSDYQLAGIVPFRTGTTRMTSQVNHRHAEGMPELAVLIINGCNR